jgi:tetratricopeptide (TPR) repeat protein
MRLGLLSLVRGARDRAVEFFERALVIDASLAVGREHELALAYHYADDFTTAERYYRRAEDVSSAAFHFDFGVTLERRGKVRICRLVSNCSSR